MSLRLHFDTGPVLGDGRTKARGPMAANTGSLAETGYSFAGWNTAADGTGTSCSAGGTLTLSFGITRYAEWTENHIDTVE